MKLSSFFKSFILIYKQSSITVLVVMVAAFSSISFIINEKSENIIVIENVAVIPMTGKKIIKNQTVLISNGKIISITETSKTKIPAGSKRIDGTNKFLLPGFIDCYAHIHEKNLSLFVANGITTVRNAPGEPFQHVIKKLVSEDKMFGPRIYSVGVPVSGRFAAYHSQGTITNEEEARFAINETKRMGYDAAFVYVTISPEIYKAANDEANKLRLSLQGHLPYMVKYEDYVNSTQVSFDNLVGFINLQTGETYPKERLLQMSKGFKNNGKYIIPTLTIHKMRALAAREDSLRQSVNMKYVPPRQRAYWHLSSKNYNYSGAALLVKTFYEQGLKILLGSDAGFHFLVPGFSYHDEMKNFSELGITNYEILKSGTKDASEYLGLQDKIGTIETGKEADLVLLDANPLETIENANKIAGVMLRGKWFEKKELVKRLNQLEQELKQMPSSANRFNDFVKPDTSFRLMAHYNIYYKDVLCGEEKIFTATMGETERIISQNSIDPICHRNTTTEWVIKNGKVTSLVVERTAIDGNTKISIQNSGNFYNVTGKVPIYGTVNYKDSLTAFSMLAGPNTSINLDMDIIANFQVILKSVQTGGPNQYDSVFIKKVELNSEEWGTKSIIGNMKYKIRQMEADKNKPELIRYEVIQPGFNGAPGFSLRALISVNKSGIVEEMIFDDNIYVKRKK